MHAWCACFILVLQQLEGRLVSGIVQIPTEDFFTNQFGLPLTMNPNFEDLSCEMIFGQKAPPIEQDPLYNQPCFAQECTLAEKEPVPCPKIDTDRHRKKLPTFAG